MRDILANKITYGGFDLLDRSYALVQVLGLLFHSVQNLGFTVVYGHVFPVLISATANPSRFVLEGRSRVAAA
jgi:hypothetical protein